MNKNYPATWLLILYLLAISAIYLMLRYIFENVLKSDELVIEGLKGKFSEEFINKQIEGRHRSVKAYFFTQPLGTLFRISLFALVLRFGVFIVRDKALTFRQLFCTTSLAEAVFLVAEALKVLWFRFFNTSYSLLEVVHYKPLSVISLLSADGLEFWQIFLFSNLGLFPLLYLFALSNILHRLYLDDFNEATQMVLYSVGIVFLLYFIGGTLLYMNF